MKSLSVATLALVLTGCASASLRTTIEVYHPRIRLQELEQVPGKDTSQTLLREEIAKRLSPVDDVLPWIASRRERIGQLRGLVGDAWAAFEATLKRNDNRVLLQAVGGVKETQEKKATAAIVDAERQFDELTSSVTSGALTGARAMAIGYEALARLQTTLREVLTPSSLIEAGNAETGVPPELQAGLEKSRGSTVVPLSPALQQTAGTSAVAWDRLAAVSSAHLFSRRDKAGIERRDELSESSTDPLLVLALKDAAGWNAVPLSLTTDIAGKSEVAIVREGQSSFTVFALSNDPSGLVRQRLRIASSTVNLLAKLATTYVGGLPSVKTPSPSPPEPAGQAEPAALAGSRLPASVRLRIAEQRLREVDELLRSNPATPDDQRLWISRANALLEDVKE